MAVSRFEFLVIEFIEMIAIVVVAFFLWKVYQQLVPETG